MIGAFIALLILLTAYICNSMVGISECPICLFQHEIVSNSENFLLKSINALNNKKSMQNCSSAI